MIYLCYALIFIGLFFFVTGAIGVVRFQDLYLRLHAASKAGTFGFGFIVLGMALMTFLHEPNPAALTKAILAIIFQFATAPVAAHVVAKVAIAKGLKPLGSHGEPAQKFE